MKQTDKFLHYFINMEILLFQDFYELKRWKIWI